MTAANLCEQCKAHATPPRSRRESPCGSSNRSSGRSSTPRGPCPATAPSKPVYVRMDPSEKTCIVLNKGDGCGAGNISLQLPSFPGANNKLRLQCGGGGGQGGGGGGGGGNCIEIMGNSIIKSARGGLQIVPGKGKGAMQISLGKGGCPVLQLGGGSSRSCGSASGGMGGGGLQVCPGGSGQLQLSFGKPKCGAGPSIICGPNGSNVEISYGPQKRKLDMNHCKPTIAFMIHKRLVELETELRMAECSYSDLHP